MDLGRITVLLQLASGRMDQDIINFSSNWIQAEVFGNRSKNVLIDSKETKTDNLRSNVSVMK